MEEFALLSPLLITVAGLLIGAILKSLLKHSNFPYTVALFVLGLGIGLLDRAGFLQAFPDVSKALGNVADTNPDFILYVFLPILIFDAAYEMNMHIFKKTLANATLLAVPGLLICMGLTAVFLITISYFLPGYEAWTWPFALMFGALISATDPVAVVALLHELKTSKRFSTLVDAESLLNDGTGIVCFMLFFGAYTLSGASDVSPLVQFVQVVAGGVLMGWLLARISIWFITRINSEEMIQNSVIILAAYLTFILSQYYLGVSGVIALVAFGLTIAYVGRPRLRPEVNIFMAKFWELLSHIANTLVFIMVGLVIAEKVDFSWLNLGVLIVMYIALNLFRFLMITLLYPIMKSLGYGLTKRESVILTWGGLRGALGMTLALMVSYTPAIPEEIRSQILFFTAGIVTLTLSINATTMRWLLKKLGLISTPSARIIMESRIRKSIRESAEKYYDKLQKREPLNGANWEKVGKYLPTPEEDIQIAAPTNDFLAEIRLKLLDKEKAVCKSLYEQGILSQTSFRRLMNSLDELYDHDGTFSMDTRNSIFGYFSRSFFLRHLREMAKNHNWIVLYFRKTIGNLYDLGRGFIIMQKEDIRLLDELSSSTLLDEKQKEDLLHLHKEVENNISRMEEQLSKLAQYFPKAYNHALTIKAIRMLLNNEKRTVRQFIAEGILSEKDADPFLDNITERADELNSVKHTLIGSLFFWRKK